MSAQISRHHKRQSFSEQTSSTMNGYLGKIRLGSLDLSFSRSNVIIIRNYHGWLGFLILNHAQDNRFKFLNCTESIWNLFFFFLHANHWVLMLPPSELWNRRCEYVKGRNPRRKTWSPVHVCRRQCTRCPLIIILNQDSCPLIVRNGSKIDYHYFLSLFCLL